MWLTLKLEHHLKSSLSFLILEVPIFGFLTINARMVDLPKQYVQDTVDGFRSLVSIRYVACRFADFVTVTKAWDGLAGKSYNWIVPITTWNWRLVVYQAKLTRKTSTVILQPKRVYIKPRKAVPQTKLAKNFEFNISRVIVPVYSIRIVSRYIMCHEIWL